MTTPWPPTCCQGFVQEGAFTHTETCSNGSSQVCPWCDGHRFIPATGVLCRTCQGQGTLPRLISEITGAPRSPGKEARSRKGGTMNDELIVPTREGQYHYARLIEGGAPTKYVRFTARKARDAWVRHDVLNRYKVMPVSSVNALLSRVTWADVGGVSMATEPTADPQLTDLLEEINTINRQVANLQGEAQIKYDEVAKVVARIYNEGKSADEHIDHECIIVDTYQACAASPTLLCVYPDEIEEFCVFCGEPEERK